MAFARAAAEGRCSVAYAADGNGCNVKLAIFDIDGTLTNTNCVDNDCFVKALSEAHAITEINTDWATYPNTTDSGITLQIFQETFGHDPEDPELTPATLSSQTKG